LSPKFRSYTDIGALPPVILRRCAGIWSRFAGEIADGLIFANASRSHMADSLAVIPAAKRWPTPISSSPHDPDLHQR